MVGSVNAGGGTGVGVAVVESSPCLGVSFACGGVTLLSIASRSNVFGVSAAGVGCGGVIASGASHHVLPCFSISLMISISFCSSISAVAVIGSSTISVDGCLTAGSAGVVVGVSV